MPAWAGIKFTSVKRSPNFAAACAPTCASKKAAPPPERALGILATVFVLLFLAGLSPVSVTSGFAKLLPKWIVVLGIIIALAGELSWLDILFPKALFLIPFTRFPGFLWMIAAGFVLPKVRERAKVPQE